MIFVFNLNGFFEFVHTNRRSHRTEVTTETCSLKYKAAHKFRILGKFLKNAYEDLKFWEAADHQPATLLKNELVQKCFSEILLTF